MIVTFNNNIIEGLMSYFKKIQKKRILLSFILLMPVLLLTIILLLISKGYLVVIPKW